MESEINYTDLYSTGVRNLSLGGGFFIVSILLKKMPPQDTFYWLLLMIPAFCLIASGVRRLIKAEELKKERGSRASVIQPPALSGNETNNLLPPTQAEFIIPVSSYTTNDLAVPSVTEETTRHLELGK